ncbi:MAG: hypothetical protein WCB56_17330 [Terriglobales bacterium]
MTLQDLLDNLEVSRDALLHFEHPEISDESFAAELHLEWADGDGSLYQINDHKREHLYVFTYGPLLNIVLQAETAENASKHVLAVMERASELASARNPKTLLKAHSQISWEKRLRLLKMFYSGLSSPGGPVFPQRSLAPPFR